MITLLNWAVAFDGWAVALISFLLGGGCGTGITYHVLKSKQKQRAGNYAKQKQEVKSSSAQEINIISQSQKAGDNAEQSQSL